MSGTEIIRVVDEAMMRRLLKKGAHIMAEYDFRATEAAALRGQGRWWVLQAPSGAMSTERAHGRTRKVA